MGVPRVPQPCVDAQRNHTLRLERQLEWSHMCPTGPSSVPTMPHAEKDPMVLEQAPRLYFCGNAPQFATTKFAPTGGRMVCLPAFAETGEAVLVNLETMAVELLRFDDNES